MEDPGRIASLEWDTADEVKADDERRIRGRGSESATTVIVVPFAFSRSADPIDSFAQGAGNRCEKPKNIR